MRVSALLGELGYWPSNCHELTLATRGSKLPELLHSVSNYPTAFQYGGGGYDQQFHDQSYSGAEQHATHGQYAAGAQGDHWDETRSPQTPQQKAALAEDITKEQTGKQQALEKAEEEAAEMESADEAREDKLNEATDKAIKMTKSARVWAERASAIVDATRQEQSDQEAVDITTDLASNARRVREAMKGANQALAALAQARRELEWQQSEGMSDKGEPDLEVPVLVAAGDAAKKAGEDVYSALQVLHRAENLAHEANQHGITAMPKLRDTDVLLAPLNEAEGADLEQDVPPSDGTPHGKEVVRATQKEDLMDDGKPKGLTSAGCTCDPQAKCAFQGRSFTWCRVGSGPCRLLGSTEKREHPLDPAMRDHDLYKSGGQENTSARGLERTGAVWDYCEPKLRAEEAGSAPRTAHGASCAWRGDIWRRYMEDLRYQKKDGTLDLKKVPMKDRLTLEVMQQYETDPGHKELCSTTESSGHFAICPTIPDPERPELAGRGWNASHSWDFCSESKWKPTTTHESIHQDKSDPEAAQVAPALPERENAPLEQPSLGSVEEPKTFPLPPEESTMDFGPANAEYNEQMGAAQYAGQDHVHGQRAAVHSAADYEGQLSQQQVHQWGMSPAMLLLHGLEPIAGPQTKKRSRSFSGHGARLRQPEILAAFLPAVC